MKSKRLILLIIVSQFTFALTAQDLKNEGPAHVRIDGLCIQLGLSSGNFPEVTLQDFRELSAGSELLKNDLTGYKNQREYFFSAAGSFGILADLQFFDKKKNDYNKDVVMNVGFFFNAGNGFSLNLNKYEENRYDTEIVSPDTIYYDTIYSGDYNFRYHVNQIRLVASLIYKLNSQSILCVYSGFSASAGLSLDAHTEIKFNFSKYRTLSSGNFSSFDNPVLSNDTAEYFTNKSSLCSTFSIPFGLDVHFSRNNSFWKRIHLYSEVRLGINIASIPEIRTYVKSNAQWIFGLRITKGD